MKRADIVRLIQITDCHLGSKKTFVSQGVNTYKSFLKVLNDVATRCAPSLIFISGDISSSGTKSSYQLFSDAMESLFIPYRWLPGNHDDFELMNTIIPQPFIRVEKHSNWVIISLVSSDPKKTPGLLAKNEIEELKLILKKYQNHFILIFVHHPPVRINSKWLDEHCITNSDQLEEILSGYSNVRGIFTGHVHQERTTNWNNLLVYSSPSTCYQFVSDVQHFQLSTDAPGYRWINLHSDGFMDTGVNYLKSSCMVS